MRLLSRRRLGRLQHETVHFRRRGPIDFRRENSAELELQVWLCLGRRRLARPDDEPVTVEVRPIAPIAKENAGIAAVTGVADAGIAVGVVYNEREILVRGVGVGRFTRLHCLEVEGVTAARGRRTN